MSELIELRQDLLEIKSMMKLLLPKEYTISYISQQTGKSRQAIRSWLIRNGEPEIDFWEKDGKIIISEEIALKYISNRRV